MMGVFSPDWGVVLLSLALVSALVQSAGGLRDDVRALAISRRAGLVCFVAIAAAFAVLVTAFLRSDFSVENVVSHSHAAKPIVYKIAAAWGNHEGSMLLWCLVLSGMGAAFAFRPGVDQSQTQRALVVFGALSAAFIAFTLFASSPFERVDPAPWSGRGFNPLLQDPAVAVHPPMLYLGYVGLSAPFALAMAALWTGRADRAWARATRRWTLLAFAFLTLGIGLGAYWAYYELGWGGWWFWDPVENASLMPWILAAALLHSAMVTERTGGLSGWTALLAIGAFSLAVLGTFLTRSGMVTSVHAFASDPTRGVILLGIFAAVLLSGLGLFAFRAARMTRASQDTKTISRENFLVANNLFLVVAALVVLTGTLTPLFAEALGERLSVGPPYYEKAALPIMAAAFVLTPLATLAPWGGAQIARRRPAAFIAAGMGVLAVMAIVLGAPIGAAITLALGAWLIFGAGLDVANRLARERSQASPWSMVRQRPSMLAAALAHAGVGLLAIGAAADHAFSTSRSVVASSGDTVTSRGYDIRLRAVGDRAGPNFDAAAAEIEVVRPGQTTAILRPEWRWYWVQEQTTSEVARKSGLGGDLYVAFGPPQTGADGRTTWTVRIMEKRMIWMVFLGIACIAGGAGLALLGAARPRGART